MYKYFFILFHFFSFKRPTLKTVLNISVILSVLICSLVIPIVLSVSNGFKSNIENKIIEFDGYARIFKNNLTIPQIEFLIDSTNFSLSKFTEIQSLVRANNISEGITYQTVDKINFLDNFLIHKSTDSLKGIYIGAHLSEKLFSNINSIDEKIFIIHNSNIYQKKNIGNI